MNEQPIYQKYSGKNRSDKLTVFCHGENYTFVYQTLKRTNPSQSDRMRGLKPKRIVLTENTYTLSQLNTVDFKRYPFFHLMADFPIKPSQRPN